MHKITFVIAIVPRLNDSIFIVIYHVSYNIHEITEASVDAHLYIYIGSLLFIHDYEAKANITRVSSTN